MSALHLVRDGTIFGPQGTEIDFRTPDYSVWLTVKADSDAEAERVAAALEAAFGICRDEAECARNVAAILSRADSWLVNPDGATIHLLPEDAAALDDALSRERTQA